nr:MAG TPA: Putative tail length tape measure protein [Caudoviricetes sp.]
MSDGRLDIDARINTQNLDKDVKSVDAKLKVLSKTGSTSLGGLVGSFASVATAAGAVVGTVALVNKGIKAVSAAYIEQTKAEKQLEIAARNNPYLNDANVAALRNYASEIQSLTVYSEGELLPMMAQLSASGRTQQQIMDIMGAAVDVAASGTMDLNSAVSSLNATYNGMAGTLGRQNGAIKNLTEEQLKNGDAVKIVAEQYKGMASEVAKTTGAGTQLKNAFDDLKSVLGKPFVEAMTPIANFFTDLINGWVDAKKKKDEYYGAKEAEKSDKTTLNQDKLLLQEEQKRFKSIDEQLKHSDKRAREALMKYNSMSKSGVFGEFSADVQAAKRELDEWNKNTGKLAEQWQASKARIEQLTTKVQNRAQAESDEAERVKAEEAAKKRAEEIAAIEKGNNDKAEAALKTYRETIATKEQELKLRKELGENITEEQENEEMLQTRIAAYIKLIQDAQGTITGEAERERIEREKILELTEKTTSAQKEAKAEEAKKALLKDLDDALGGEKLKQSEIMAKQISDLEIEYEKLTAEKKAEINEEYTQKLKELSDKRQQMIAEEKAADERATLESVGKKIEIITSFASQYTNIMTTISDMITKQAQNEATVKQAALEKQYNDGLISQTEYQKRKDEIEKEAAEKTYRIQMWQWAGSIAQATANTAQAMISTLAQETGPAALKIAMAAMVAAAGGAQLATIIANKPIPPSNFATGGIVGGTSYTGDRVTANVNSGEMILNRMQQRHLFDSINSNQLGTKPQMNVKIFNSASNEVSARPEMTEDGMRIMIRKIVSDDIGSGRINKSLIAAQSSFGGTRYTN